MRLTNSKEIPMADNPMPVIDGHNDVLLSVYRAEEGKERSFFTRSEEGHLDLPRAHEGGFAGGFFAVFIPPPPAETPETAPPIEPANSLDLPPPLDHGYAQREAMGLVAGLLRLEAESLGQVKIVRT